MADHAHQTVLSLTFTVTRDPPKVFVPFADFPLSRLQSFTQFLLLGFQFQKCQLLPLLPGWLFLVNPFARRTVTSDAGALAHVAV